MDKRIEDISNNINALIKQYAFSEKDVVDLRLHQKFVDNIIENLRFELMDIDGTIARDVDLYPIKMIHNEGYKEALVNIARDIIRQMPPGHDYRKLQLIEDTKYTERGDYNDC